LRHLLKAALRAWGLRAVRVEELPSDPPAGEQAGSAKPPGPAEAGG
jgi:hypothetical protein